MLQSAAKAAWRAANLLAGAGHGGPTGPAAVAVAVAVAAAALLLPKQPAAWERREQLAAWAWQAWVAWAAWAVCP